MFYLRLYCTISCKTSSPFRKKRSKEGKSNNPKCLFCGAELDKPMKVRGGGRASFCDSCAKLEKGFLRWYKDKTVGLRKPLLHVIERF